MQEFTLEEYREGMVCCGTLIDCLCRAIRELEAQLAEDRSEVQEGRCRCSQAQFSALYMHHDRSGESTTLRQPTSSAYKDDAISSSSGQQSLPPVFVVPPTPEENPCPNRSESSSGHQHRTSLNVPNKTPLLLQDARTQMKMRPGSYP
ncbi:hypothetical protein DSO57_1029797 [Entomophthora muscae]|uniref:Uncharacterized protein n=1 Tax=Entomophthora muscae TaxID=34485 RepID=A0ACC2T108_9FUNG|nr:hypothetical protein DSO57_1029797 [Entomophthora muscae]